MPKDRKLKAALDRAKGVDHKQEHQKKLQKQAEKRKLKKKRGAADVGALEDDVAGDEEDVDGEELADVNVAELRQEVAAQLAEKANGAADGWETDESEDGEDGEEEEGGVNLETFEDESESDSDEDQTFYTAAGGSPEKGTNGVEHAEDDDDEEDEKDIPLSDIDSLASDEKGDLVPHQRLTINNTVALNRSLKSFALPSTLPFSATQSVTTTEPVVIEDVEDDLSRELAFYKQSLDAVKEARIRLKKEGVLFTRPTDYFAEMVKSEEQMGKVRSKQLDEAARKKASSDARRQRDLKKFGKAVQVAKLQERDKAKRDMLDKVNVLKRKRQGADPLTANEDDIFDVALEDAATTDKKDRAARKGSDRGRGSNRGRGGSDRGGSRGRDSGPNKRAKKDEKFGFGGKKRFGKSNDAQSAGDVSGFSARRMKGGARGGEGGMRGGGRGGGRGGARGGSRGGARGGKIRPGKSRRANMS